MEFPLLTTADVAKLLKVSTRAVREWANQRTRTGSERSTPLPSFRISPRILRFEKSAVLQWASLHNPLHKITSALPTQGR